VRKTVLILGVVVASLGLSACDSGTKATIDSSITSLGAQPDLQVHLTASVSGPARPKHNRFSTSSPWTRATRQPLVIPCPRRRTCSTVK